jgi:hypothetical protein
MGHSSSCMLSTRGRKLWGLHVECPQEGENYMGHRSACRLSTRLSKLWRTAPLHVGCLQDGVNYGAQVCMQTVY